MDKVVFITGGSTGIGNACVHKFHNEGYKVAFMDINQEEGQKIANNLKDVLFIAGDTKNKEDIKNAVARALEKFGNFDVISLNAGIHRCNTILDISDEELDLIIQTNIYGYVNTMRIAIPHMKKEGGSIVINASDQCFVGKPNSFAYGLTKGALGQITKSLSLDLAPKIRVNAVCAGTIKTPMTERLFQDFANITHGGNTDFYWQNEAEKYPLKKVGQANEVAELIYFLASPKASFITGGLYLIDGGLTAGIPH
ncbi:SDR family NAD(P)-dependent oxidoreductase [Campylobacter coli]